MSITSHFCFSDVVTISQYRVPWRHHHRTKFKMAADVRILEPGFWSQDSEFCFLLIGRNDFSDFSLTGRPLKWCHDIENFEPHNCLLQLFHLPGIEQRMLRQICCFYQELLWLMSFVWWNFRFQEFLGISSSGYIIRRVASNSGNSNANTTATLLLLYGLAILYSAAFTGCAFTGDKCPISDKVVSPKNEGKNRSVRQRSL